MDTTWQPTTGKWKLTKMVMTKIGWRLGTGSWGIKNRCRMKEHEAVWMPEIPDDTQQQPCKTP